ncbi:ASCH domain-containing protein [Pantoea phytobeneficialis]|uniref:ASCH domain-containing protein n=1 Tax=Pantoea phytobeneficialis TaxID=2052056 RepID=A0AAP9HAP2_9GAMM|nr:ASCH domain-containing protein [Pantoea phytobeneficialis]MDO6406887.1 hypothetical protein [Pantoea phytobeneficialis]QGR09855.1 hypothetical protein CTZ24_25665 [Pantoea phytobeneficialis]
MQSLEIVPRLLPEVRSGKKRHTIRWQEREITSGPMLYVNAEDVSDMVIVWVTHVETMPLFSVAQHLGKIQAWPDDVLLAGMREHYPGIEMDSIVSVIHHLPPASD